MRRIKAPRGDLVLSGPTRVVRVAPILLAGCVGYLLGSAHLDVFRAADSSAAEAVAARFPEDWRSTSLAAATTALRTAPIKPQAPNSANTTNMSVASTSVMTSGGVQSGLFNPEPAVAQVEQDPGAPATIQTASADDAAPVRVSASNPVTETASAQPSTVKSVQSPVSTASGPEPATKLAAVAPHHPVNERPGYMLNDAQIASIKQRLHLTPDQEQMWPAVEAALRNIAYTHNQQARRHGAATQTAEVDPNAVQGLKSAAVPLILSFNDEQKEEVRNLVHVMGLDQLASQF